MKIESLTDIGVKRKENQDNFWSSKLLIDGSEACVVCLCDGMGGLNDGGLASRMVVESVRDAVLSGIEFLGLKGVLEQVNGNIYKYAQEKSQQMGTTCTLLQCKGNSYEVFHVGDSRCYLLRNGSYTAITEDHSAVRKYGITRKNNESLWKKYKNSLTRCIGIKDSVEVDYYKGSYSAGDGFFLCSDGVWHYLDENIISLRELSDLSGLVNACIDSGELDNMTGCIVYV